MQFEKLRNVRLQPDAGTVRADEQVLHRRISGDDQARNVVLLKSGVVQHRFYDGDNGLLAHRGAEFLDASGLPLLDDPVDHVGAVADLPVPAARLRHHLSRRKIQKGSRDGGRADVDRDAVTLFLYAAGEAGGKDGIDGSVIERKFFRGGKIGGIDTGLVRTRHDGKQEHGVAVDGALARKAPPVLKILLRKMRILYGIAGAADQPDHALAAGPAAAARRVDIHTVVSGNIQYILTGRGGYLDVVALTGDLKGNGIHSCPPK